MKTLDFSPCLLDRAIWGFVWRWGTTRVAGFGLEMVLRQQGNEADWGNVLEGLLNQYAVQTDRREFLAAGEMVWQDLAHCKWVDMSANEQMIS